MARKLALLLLALSPGSWAADLTAQQWREDLRVLSTQLPKLHKNLFYTLPKAEFQRQVNILDESIPTMKDADVRAALVRLVASANNAHTTIDAFRNSPVFPIAFSEFPGGIFVTGTAAPFPDAPTAKLVAVNGKPVDEVKQRLLPYFAKENDVAKLVEISNLLRMAAPLRAAGVIPSFEHATYTLERNGKRFDVALDSSSAIAFTGTRAKQPRAFVQNRDRKLDYWFEALPDSSAVYVQYNACRDRKEQTFAAFTQEVLRAVDANHAKRLVIDLRFNGGGDSRVVGPLVNAVKARKGKLPAYVLVGRNTYSSAYMAARDLKSAGAVLVGEAMGQRPNTYGDIRPLKLPNSGLTVFYCTKFFRFSKTDVPQEEPSVLVPITAHDFFAGVDAPLEYALAHI